MSTAKRKQIKKSIVGCLCFALVAAGMAAAPDVPSLSGIGAVSVSAAADPVYVSEVDLGQIVNYASDSGNCPTGVTAQYVTYTNTFSDIVNLDIIELTLTQSGTYKFSGSNLIGGAYVDVKIIVPAGVEATVEFAEDSTIINDCGDYKYTGGIYYSYTNIDGDCLIYDYAAPFRVEAGSSLKVTGDLSVDTYSYYGSCGSYANHGKHGNSAPLYEGDGTFTANRFTVKYVDDDGLTVDEQYFLNKPADPKKDGYTFGGWYTDKDCTIPYDFTSPVTGNVILYPKWVVDINLNELLAAAGNSSKYESTGVTVYYYSDGCYNIILNESYYKISGSNLVNEAYVDVTILPHYSVKNAYIEFDNASIINSGYYLDTYSDLACNAPFFTNTDSKLTISGKLNIDTLSIYNGSTYDIGMLDSGYGSLVMMDDYFTVQYVDEDGVIVDKNYYLSGYDYDVTTTGYIDQDKIEHSIAEEFLCMKVPETASENTTITARKTHIDEDSDHECDNCSVSAKVTGIEIGTAPAKTSYFIGQELDVTGGKIAVSYEDDSTVDVDITADMVSGFDSAAEGTKTLTVTYGGKTATFTVTVKKGDVTVPPSENNVGGAKIDMPIEDLINAVLDDEDRELIKQGVDISVLMATVTIDPEYVPEKDKAAIDDVLNDFSVGCYLDVNLFKRYSNGTPDKKVTDPNSPITISFEVPQYIIDQYPEDEYVYSVFCSHNGVGYPVESRYDADTNIMTFTSDKFSTYALGVKEEKSEPAEYTITSDSHVTAPTAAKAGDRVTVIVEDGYKAVIRNEAGIAVAFISGNGAFVMPESNVTIISEAVSTVPDDHTIISDSHVTVPDKANAGDTVTLIVEDGYKAVVKDTDGNVVASVTGTGTFTMPDSAVTISCEKISSDTVKYYSVSADCHVTIGTSFRAGEVVHYRVADLYEAVIYVNGSATGKIRGTGSFVMPAADVRIESSINGAAIAMSSDIVANSYVYCYDTDMNKIKVSGTRKKNNFIIIDLGEEYAGRTITIYKGRKSAKEMVTEGTLDKNGKFKFENAGFGSNYTLIVSD